MTIKLIGRTATIRFTPSIEFKLSDEDLGALFEMSAGHYDRECKAAGKPGGVVFRFRSTMETCGYCAATFRELDLCAKILEMYNYVSDPEVREPAESLAFAFEQMLRAMNAQSVEPVVIEDEDQ